MALDSSDDMELDLVKTTRASSLADDSSIHSTNYSTRSMRHVVPSTAALPPVDGGRSAWLFLAGATVIEILVWGLPFSVGVLHSYWVRELFPGTGGENLLATAATLQTGLMYCACPIFGPLFIRYAHRRRQLQTFGLVMAVIAIAGSGFASEPWHLVVTLGCIYPFSCLLYFPAATLLFEWFQSKRGIASGIMYAGTGMGGAIFPFIMEGLITRFGYRMAMVSLAIGFGVLGAGALSLIKPRIPVPQKGSPEARLARRIDRRFLQRSTLYAFTGAILFNSLGGFIPSVWIPAFATDINLTTKDGTLLLSLMNGASVPGLLLLGWLSDHAPLRFVIALSCFGSALACLFIWGFATNMTALVIFSIFFGALGLSFTALWTRLISIVAKDDPALPTVIFSLFAFARGIGNISSGPVSTLLLDSNILRGAKGAYGVKNYGALLLYTGITMIAGSFVGITYRDKPTGTPRARAGSLALESNYKPS